MNPTAWQAAEWAAFGQVGALVVAIVAGALVWLQVRHGRQIREDQNRPYVIVDFELRGTLVLISARNIGTTPAATVRIEFNTTLVSPAKDMDPERLAVFSDPIAMMAPGRVISVPFGRAWDFFPADGVPPPLRYEAKVSYTDLAGKHRYEDPACTLDLAPFKHTPIYRDDLREIAVRLKGMEQAMGRWTKSGRLRVNTMTQAEIDERDAAHWEQVRARRQRSETSAAARSDDEPRS